MLKKILRQEKPKVFTGEHETHGYFIVLQNDEDIETHVNQFVTILTDFYTANISKFNKEKNCVIIG